MATAVIEGDLTRQVRVEASGEVAALKDTVNEMIRNLGETTRQNVEQDWLKTNRERFIRMLQGQRDLGAVSTMILSELAGLVSAQHGVFYSMTSPAEGVEPALELQTSYGYEERRQLSTSFRLGEGLVGQCALEKKRILLTDVPSDYVRINSGLGASPPLNIIVLPVLFEGSVRAVVELASFSPFSITHQTFLDQLTESIGLVLNTIEANTLTENLLAQSQSLAAELRSQQEELRQSNEDLEGQASLLAQRSAEAEQKNEEVQRSQRLLEEKAGQLAVSSKYKSEFIANMSHDLRTPLNSLLILAERLEEDPEHTMSVTQVEYASMILASGRDLLELLNSTLELAKVESGTVGVELADVSAADTRPPGPRHAADRVAREVAPRRTAPNQASILGDRLFAGSKVLVVDDDSRNIFAMTALLERGHGKVTAVASGAEALAALQRTTDIDLVLMDIMMPAMDGYETIRAIRALDRFKSLPIIAVTARVVAGERERCLEAGADDYVPKPVNTAELLAVVGPWLHTAARAG